MQREQAMTKLAESLRARAAAGEDFAKLQKEAFDAAGHENRVSDREFAEGAARRALPPAHAAVFELKAGEVSQVISDTGGHYIYKVNSKDLMTLDQAKDEIHSTLQNERDREMMEKMNNSFHAETNEAYFGPGGPARCNRRRGCRIRGPGRRDSMPPAQQQTPPPAATSGCETELMAKPVVVVTGVSGNLGSRLLPLLGSFSVIGVDVSPPQTDSELEV